MSVCATPAGQGKTWVAFKKVGLVSLLACVPWGLPAHAADALERLNAGEQPDDGLVHCLFPGQVRRLGAFSTSMTPRRAARVTPQACAAGGGEYIEPQDLSMAATKVWLPLAADGVPEAQVTLGELYERQGKPALAKAWYEKAAAQGVARAAFNLAALLSSQAAGVASGAAGSVAQTGLARAASASVSATASVTTAATSTQTSASEGGDRVAALLTAASGGLVAGLGFAQREPLKVEFVAPSAAAPLPRPVGGQVLVEAEPGPATVVARVVAPGGLASVASVQVNGQDQSPDAQGFLSIPVSVGEARTSVTVQAQDNAGHQAQAQLALVQRSPSAGGVAGGVTGNGVAPAAAVVAAAAKSPVELLKGRRLALVLSNEAYVHWPRLDTPVSDGRAVAAALQQRFGFEPTLLLNANRQQMLAALARLRQQAGPEDQVLVYYAGHGHMDPVTARGYWIPVDGAEQDLAQWVSVIDVTDQLAAMQARHVMVIADSCYAGTLVRSLIPQIDQALSPAQRVAPLQHLAQQRVRVALTSGGLEPVVDGGSIDHSLFARSLLDVLDQVQAPVAAQEFFGAVSSRFAHLARRLKVPQQPQYAPIGFAGHEAGDFVLAPR